MEEEEKKTQQVKSARKSLGKAMASLQPVARYLNRLLGRNTKKVTGNKPPRRSSVEVKVRKALLWGLGAVIVICLLTVILWLFDKEWTSHLLSLRWYRVLMLLVILFVSLCPLRKYKAIRGPVSAMMFFLCVVAIIGLLRTPLSQFDVLSSLWERVTYSHPVLDRGQEENSVVDDRDSVVEESGNVEPPESSEQETWSITSESSPSVTLHLHLPDPQPPQYLYLPTPQPSDEGDEEEESEECDEGRGCQVNAEVEEQVAISEVRRNPQSYPTARDRARQPFSIRAVPLESREVDVTYRKVPID